MSDNVKKRQRESESLPSCLKGNAPPENHKRRVIEKFSVESNVEEDERRIEQRLKQIKFGKNTIGYDRYLAAVPKDRRKGYSEHPRTPDPYEKVPKRAFDGRIKTWRRQLHKWDVENTTNGASPGSRGTEQNETGKEKIDTVIYDQDSGLDPEIDLSCPEEEDDVL